MQPHRRAVVVMKPPYNLHPDLIACHVEHHVLLGFERYLLYLTPESVDAVLGSHTLLPWIRSGMVVPVLWDMTESQPHLPAWGQRLIYTHAVLAHKAQHVHLFMPDFDEYLVATRPGLDTIADMVRACAPPVTGAGPHASLQLQRRHVVADAPAGDGGASEAELLLQARARGQHPLARHTRINLSSPPYIKSMVDPTQIMLFFIHEAKAFNSRRVFDVDAGCMLLSHLPNLYAPRVAGASALSHFRENPEWSGAVARLLHQQAQWRQRLDPSLVVTQQP
uniref:Glycosyltransferase family 92 protein n=1 Tax=Chlamydomonas euryale TaxID=1486919 RepID=A0A7R9VBJ1_9CHLO